MLLDAWLPSRRSGTSFKTVGIAALLVAAAASFVSALDTTAIINTTTAAEEEHRAEVDRLPVHTAKAVVLAIILLVSTVVYVSTCIGSSGSCARRVPSIVPHLIASFSAGVFIYVAVAHLLAEGNEIIGALSEERFRAAYACCIAGYLVTVTIQNCVGGEGHSHDGGGGGDPNDGHLHVQEPDRDQPVRQMPDAVPPSVVDVTPSVLPTTTTDQQYVADVARRGDTAKDEYATVIATLLAFAIHAAAEGLALGLQSTVAGVVMIAIGIISHSWAEELSFAVIVTRRLPTASPAIRLVFMLVKASFCPIAIAIGWSISNVGSPTAAVGYTISVSAGTFLYIGLTELVPELYSAHSVAAHSGESPLVRAGKQLVTSIALITGALVIFTIQVLTFNPDAHDH